MHSGGRRKGKAMNAKPERDASMTALWDDLRGWISEPTILLEQISYLLMLKRLSREEEPPSNRGGPDLRWNDLGKLGGHELVARMSRHLIPFVAASMPASIRPTMEEARFAIDDPKLLRSCIERIDRLQPGSEGEVFEELLRQQGRPGDNRQVRTPPAVAAAMVDLVEPKAGDTICDPATGSGSLLLEAASRIGPGPGSSGAKLYGFDIDPGKVRLAAFNLIFHGIANPQIEQADVLASAIQPEKFDVVLCAPPFGGLRGEEEVDGELAEAGKRTELLYLERCRQMQRGRAAILVPEAILFGRTGKFTRARREWLQRRRVDAVILLPPGILGFTNIRSAILVASCQGTTEEVWFCPIGEKRGRETAPDASAVEAQLGCVAEALRSKLGGEEPVRPEAVELGIEMFSIPIDKIKENNWSLSPAFYRDIEVPQIEENPIELIDEISGVESEITRLLERARRLLAEAE